MKKLLFILFCFCQLGVSAKDILVFGNKQSEKKHELRDSLSETYIGGMGESARRMLPGDKPDWRGGSFSFKMRVAPDKQNYFTVRCWGSESDETMVLLFIEGKQIGYRHLGDIDLLHRGNGQKPFYERFYYYTLPLPRKYTDGKKEVLLEMRAYGTIWDYGNTFESYQKNMTMPTIGFYKAYTHEETCFVPDKNERQGTCDIASAPIRPQPGMQLMDTVKQIVIDEMNRIMKKKQPLNQQEIWFIADAYSVKWTPAFQNSEVIKKVTEGIDAHYQKYLENPAIIYSDPGVYNGDWMTTAMLARSIRKLWNELKTNLDIPLSGTTRRAAWSELMDKSCDYGITHRRHYTNQSMIIDMAVYECNRAQMLLDVEKALPEYQTLKYLYESLALAPWLGRETANGPEKKLGDNYWQLTEKGLTKELGFTGYYGEVLDWIIAIYDATCVPGIPGTGDAKIYNQLIRMMDARNFFRYQALDEDGYRCMRAEAVVGWRDGCHYPGDITYIDRTQGWGVSPFMTAAATLHPRAIGISQQMLHDNQYFNQLKTKIKSFSGIRVIQSYLHVPDEYELITGQSPVSYRLPTSHGMPDFVFSDEEDGVIALKHGDDVLFASLYWRARMGINNLAKVHYITPVIDHISTICIESEYTPSGMTYTRSNRTNLEWLPTREWYPDIHSAHEGEVLPIAKIPDGISFKPGDENPYAGKADFYKMQYGNYIIGMNTTTDKTFELKVPEGKKIVELTNDKRIVKEKVLKVKPRSSIVLYKL